MTTSSVISGMIYTLSATTPACNIPLQANQHSSYGNTQVETLRISKESMLESIPFPNRDSNYALAWDIMGVTRNIVITGTAQGEPRQLKRFILDIENRINGQQYYNTTPARTTLFTTSMGAASSNIDLSYNVVMKNFTWNYNAGEPAELNYTLEMMEGSTA